MLRRDLGRSLTYLVDTDELLSLADIPSAASGAFVPRLREALVSLKALAQLNDVVRVRCGWQWRWRCTYMSNGLCSCVALIVLGVCVCRTHNAAAGHS